MKAEVTEAVGAERHEHTDERTAYPNGSRTRLWREAGSRFLVGQKRTIVLQAQRSSTELYASEGGASLEPVGFRRW